VKRDCDEPIIYVKAEDEIFREVLYLFYSRRHIFLLLV